MTMASSTDKTAIDLFKEQLASAIVSSPIIYIPHFHFAYIDEMLECIIGNNEAKVDFGFGLDGIVEYEISREQIDFTTKEKNSTAFINIADYLSEIIQPKPAPIDGCSDTRKVKDSHHLFLFKNAHKELQEGSLQSLLQTYVQKHERGDYDKRRFTIIFVSALPISMLPTEIVRLMTVITLPLPDLKDIERELGLADEQISKHIFDKTLKTQRYVFSRDFCKNEKEFLKNRKELVSALHGMQIFDIRKALMTIVRLHKFISTDYPISVKESVPLAQFILKEKRQLVNNSSLLEVVELPKDQKDRIGNIASLSKFIQNQQKIIDNIIHYPTSLPKPKGILLVGPPGCGKSETVKSVAAIFDKPLLRLDIGKLMGEYVGQSEHNLIEAIKIAEAAQPCVLWIDEIEKAFAGFGNNNQNNDITVTRMVGYFLTWMQERKSLVYLVATANDLDSLRPEFLRKGRWDQIFYLCYPDAKGASEIFCKCVKKYGLLFKDKSGIILTNDGKVLKQSVIDAIGKLMSESYLSGAEIDSIVVQSFNEGWNVSSSCNLEHEAVVALINRMIKEKKEADEQSYKKKIDDLLLEYKLSVGKANPQNLGEIRTLLQEKYQKKSPKDIISEYQSKGYIPAS